MSQKRKQFFSGPIFDIFSKSSDLAPKIGSRAFLGHSAPDLPKCPRSVNNFFPNPFLTSFCKYCIDLNVLRLGTHFTRRALKNAADAIYECSKRSCERQVMTIFVEKAIVSRRSVPSRGFCFPRKTCPKKTAWPLGVAFLAGAFVFPETRPNTNPWRGVPSSFFFSGEKRVLKKREGG